jgi:hypothetical protein
MPRTENQTLIEQLLGVKSWPVFFYEIQIKDEGKGTAGTGTFTADDKAWDDNEWITDTAFNNSAFTDRDGTNFTISANSDDTLTLSGTPVTGDFELKRWLYLASYSEGYIGTYLPITFHGKSYLPYPVKIGDLGSYELGQFPQISLSMPNPGVQVLDVYRALEKYNGLRGCTVNIITAFIDENGDLYEDTDIQLIDQFIIQQPTITNTTVTFNLQNFGNLSDKIIPARTYSKVTCGFIYQDENCKNCGDIPTCTKLLSALIFSNIIVTYVSGDIFSTTEDLSSYVEENGTSVLEGCKVELGKENSNLSSYLWEITNVDISYSPHRLTISMPSGIKPLSSYGNNVTINVIDKFSCGGHRDPGNIDIPMWTDYPTENIGENPDVLSSHKEKGNLLIDSYFGYGEDNTWVIIDGLTKENITNGNGLLIEKTYGAQSIHIQQNFTIPDTEGIPQIELGHNYILYTRYYGYSVGASASNFRVWIQTTYKSTSYFFNFITKNWTPGSVFDTTNSVEIPLRSSAFKIDFKNSTVMENIKKDEYYCMVPLNITPIGNPPHVITHCIVCIGSQSTDTVTFNVLIQSFGLYRFIQTEHFGGFPAMPMSRLWYV